MADLVVPELGFTPGPAWTAAPCGWTVQPCGPLPDPDDEAYEPLRQASAGVLWALSGRQFGVCPTTKRPCRYTCVPAGQMYPPDGRPADWWLGASLTAGQWINVFCRGCGSGRCSCPSVSEIRLPGPVAEVYEVRIDGGAVPTGSYRVDDGEWLVRVNSDPSVRVEWPTCQDMSLPITEVGTFAVSYGLGVPIPPGGQRALGEMMSELWKACSGSSGCRLPQRVQTIARQGVTFAMLDPMDFLSKGKTGLYFCDLWLQSVNPLGRPSGARVVSPDYEEPRETTWQA